MSDLRIRIADEISNIQVGSGYESTTIGITAALEAADALIAAGVVTEEPGWEYGYELIESDTRDVLSRGWPFDTAEQAGEDAAKRAAEEFDPEYPPLIPQVVRRSKCGPWLAVGGWVPVKQEGASPSGLPVAGLLHTGGDSHAEREDADQPETDAEPVPERLIHPPGDDEHEQEQGADEQVPVELHTDDSTPDGRHTGMKQEGAAADG